MAAPTIDFHVHLAPSGRLAEQFAHGIEKHSPLALPVLRALRDRGRRAMRPLLHSLHRGQPFLRLLPEGMRRPLDSVQMAATLPSLLLESTYADLKAAMQASGVDYALLIAHPPVLSNETVLELAAGDPAILAAVKLTPQQAHPDLALREYVQRGARVLKIHAAADGLPPDSAHYHAQLAVANELGLPVVIHTGCMHAPLFFKDPELGTASAFAPWFGEYPETRFVLAHMNFHDPDVAMELAETHPNVWVDTSWQPSEIIGEAVRRIGADRVMFGTDWPFIGDNIRVGKARVLDCVAAGTLTEAESRQVLGANAQKLLGLPETDPHAD